MIPENSCIPAMKAGLIEHLQLKTEIDWEYYDSSIVPSQGARGGLKVSKVLPHSNQELNLDVSKKKVVLIQGRLLLATTESEDSCENCLLDWENYLDNIFHSLSFHGLTGTWKHIKLEKALMGIKPSPRGYQIGVEEIQSVQGSDIKMWKGLLFFEYEHTYEKKYLSPFSF